MMRVAHPNDAAIDDARVLLAQLGRTPRGSFRTCVRCGFGRPVVIETEPLLASGEPFPTLYYLTCPWLVNRVSALESAQFTGEFARLLATDDAFAQRMRAADAEYRARRAAAAGGTDPVPDVGIAGQRDPLATKCLHAHVAARLAGVGDPVGEAVLARIDAGEGRECASDDCASLVAGHDEGGDAT